MDQLYFIKIRNFWSLKDINKMKKQASDWEKVFSKHVSEKVLVSRIHKELLQFRNNEKNNSLFLKRQKI